MFTAIGTSEQNWAGKPYTEIREIGSRNGSVLVVPVGSIEQHGHHLPVATDTILVDAMAHAGGERVADEVPLLITPPVWSGFSPHHLSLGGTLSLEFAHLRAVLEDIASTGLENGFDAVLFLNGHGGNMALINAVVSTLGKETDTEVLGTTYFQLATDEVSHVRDSDIGGMAHGGEFETSLMLYLRDELVGEIDEKSTDPWDEHYEWSGQDLLNGGPLGVYREFEEYSASGAIGEPKLASADKGENIHNAIGEELGALLVAIHEHNA
jgi:creatinine amidohydrolase